MFYCISMCCCVVLCVEHKWEQVAVLRNNMWHLKKPPIMRSCLVVVRAEKTRQSMSTNSIALNCNAFPGIFTCLRCSYLFYVLLLVRSWKLLIQQFSAPNIVVNCQFQASSSDSCAWKQSQRCELALAEQLIEKKRTQTFFSNGDSHQVASIMRAF